MFDRLNNLQDDALPDTAPEPTRRMPDVEFPYVAAAPREMLR
jgi:hypothetical protein